MFTVYNNYKISALEDQHSHYDSSSEDHECLLKMYGNPPKICWDIPLELSSRPASYSEKHRESLLMEDLVIFIWKLTTLHLMFINVKVIGNCCFLKSYNAFDYWFYLRYGEVCHAHDIELRCNWEQESSMWVCVCSFMPIPSVCKEFMNVHSPPEDWSEFSSKRPKMGLLLASFHLTKIVTGGLCCFTVKCPQKEEENINHIDLFLSNYDCPKLQIQNVNSKKKKSFICNALTTWTCQSLVSCFCHLNVEKAAKWRTSATWKHLWPSLTLVQSLFGNS